MFETLIYLLFTAVMAAFIYVLYEHWEDEQAYKKRQRNRPKAGPPKKQEYDCTENYYQD